MVRGAGRHFIDEESTIRRSPSASWRPGAEKAPHGLVVGGRARVCALPPADRHVELLVSGSPSGTQGVHASGARPIWSAMFDRKGWKECRRDNPGGTRHARSRWHATRVPQGSATTSPASASPGAFIQRDSPKVDRRPMGGGRRADPCLGRHEPAGGGAAVRKVRLVQQSTAVDCAAACLAMVLNYHGHGVSLRDVRDRTGVGRDGLSARDVMARRPRLWAQDEGLLAGTAGDSRQAAPSHRALAVRALRGGGNVDPAQGDHHGPARQEGWRSAGGSSPGTSPVCC